MSRIIYEFVASLPTAMWVNEIISTKQTKPQQGSRSSLKTYGNITRQFIEQSISYGRNNSKMQARLREFS